MDTVATWDSMTPPSPAVPIADGQHTSNSRKRSRTDDSDTSVVITATTKDGARPKKRGRPRLTQADNKTYLERRRTQVRVAQQKYRNKKEQSIVDLEQQVKEEKAQRRALEQGFQHFLSLLQDNDTMLDSPEDVLSSFTALRQRLCPADLDKKNQQDNQSTSSSASGQHQPHSTTKQSQATWGFEGDFLDCNEVERYLQDLGIDIPANAEFVYAELNPARFADGQATDTVPVHAVDSDVYASSAVVNNAQDWSAYGATSVFDNGTEPCAPDINGLNPFLCPAVPPKAWVNRDPSNLLFATKISVPMLVEEIMGRCVCLGRTPGVRPKDVDRAIKIASGNAAILHLPSNPASSYTTLQKTQCLLNSPHASALDIASRAVELLEDDPLYNAGRGAVFTRDGINEMEASVMVTRGHAKRTAGVMGLRHVRNPILLAREILLRGDDDLLGLEGDAIAQEGLDVPSAQGHTLLHGPTAEALARQYGLSLVSPEYFFTQRRWDEHVHSLSRARLGKGRVATYSSETYLPQGTCGAVVVDSQGIICVATSTGGLTNKLTGRIGDTPTPGAGYWAEEWVDKLGTSSPSSSVYNTAMEITGALKGILADCLPTPFQYAPLNRDTITTKSMAVSGTGNGDSFLRTGAARSVAAMARYAPFSTRTSLTRVAGPGGELQHSAGNRWDDETGEGQGGMIGIESTVTRDAAGRVVDATTDVVMDFNCGGMFRAWFDEHGKARMSIWTNDGDDADL
ncbi:uncharacterized protein J7T54_005629 [Emericellopsis cladophorae]|uniref:BZIP domain-containing protein n=1 Tax=Emericellopsis cladophorae TaxID=2686198 RepID=A0A9P9Y5V8_9HYPO|nr:uncharacterized protein J7T54_005629 [Emericellopsis cladophorae]KAI6783600.1 hypothetical protein J7T54_005629 [Emericellopsis cladophorae]